MHRCSTVEDKDDDGYRFTYYSNRDDSEKKPIFFKRKDYPDIVYRTEEAKLRAIGQEILLFPFIRSTSVSRYYFGGACLTVYPIGFPWR